MLSIKDQETNFKPTGLFDLIFTKNPNKIPVDAPIYNVDTKFLTFGELEYQIRKCAYNLKEKYNIQKGDVVALHSAARLERPVIVHAVIFAGGTVAFIRFTPDQTVEGIAEDLETVGPKLFIVEHATRQLSLQAAEKAGIPVSQMAMLTNDDEEEVDGIDPVKRTLLSGDDILSTPYPFNDDEIENSPIFIFFTSGTTGKAKAVMGTTNAALSHLEQYYCKQFPAWMTLSFGRPHGTETVFSDFLTNLILGRQIYFSHAVTLDEILKDVEKYKIKKITTQPFIIGKMMKDVDYIKNTYDISSLKVIAATGNIMTTDIIEAAKTNFGIYVINVYGSTETRGAFLTTPKLSAIGAIGKLGPAYQARVVDENEQDVGIGETGELLLKGVCITKGYIKNPEANANAFTKDGYYRTGDLVKRDKDGVFWFMSRCKDLMKYQRTHIYPCEIEHVVLTHPKVLECGVIGIFSRELLTDLPRAYITLVHKEDYEDKERIANEVLQYANGLLPEMKRIRAGIVIKNELKRTTSGKILYLALKEEALNE